MLFKKKIQRLCDTIFLRYRKYKYYTLVFPTKQWQRNQAVVFARHTFPKSGCHWKQPSCKPRNKTKSTATQWTSGSAELFRPTRCCQSQHHRYSQTSMTVSTAAVTVALRPPLAPNSSTLWTQEPGRGPRLAQTLGSDMGHRAGLRPRGSRQQPMQVPLPLKASSESCLPKPWVQREVHKIKSFKPHVEQTLFFFFPAQTQEKSCLGQHSLQHLHNSGSWLCSYHSLARLNCSCTKKKEPLKNPF